MVATERRDKYVVDLELNVNMCLITDVADEREPQMVRLDPQSITDSAERRYGMFELTAPNWNFLEQEYFVLSVRHILIATQFNSGKQNWRKYQYFLL